VTRAVAAFMTLLFLVQPTLAGRAAGCDSSARGDAHGTMAGMSPRAHLVTGSTGATDRQGSDGHHPGCDGSSAMTVAQCAIAGGCATTGAVVPALEPGLVATVASASQSLTADAPVSWHARPELPPPRA